MINAKSFSGSESLRLILSLVSDENRVLRKGRIRKKKKVNCTAIKTTNNI